MKTDPYMLLGISENVSDDEVRDAYHKALRRYPPEKCPEMFTAISAAWESISTEQKRVYRRLFNRIDITGLDTFFSMPDDGNEKLPLDRNVWTRQARRSWMESRLK